MDRTCQQTAFHNHSSVTFDKADSARILVGAADVPNAGFYHSLISKGFGVRDIDGSRDRVLGAPEKYRYELVLQMIEIGHNRIKAENAETNRIYKRARQLLNGFHQVTFAREFIRDWYLYRLTWMNIDLIL